MLFTAFLPAISPEALKAISGEVRRWRLHRRTGHDLDDLAEWINPIVRGWMNYYGRFYRSRAVSPPAAHQRLPDALGSARSTDGCAPFKRVKRWWDGLVDRAPRPVHALAVDGHVRLDQMRRAV